MLFYLSISIMIFDHLLCVIKICLSANGVLVREEKAK